MKKYVLFFSLLLAPSLCAFANEKSEKKTSSPTDVSDLSNQELRTKFPYYVAPQIGIATGGVKFGYRMDRWSLEAGYHYYFVSNEGYSDEDVSWGIFYAHEKKETTISTHALSLEGKYFVGSTFYVGAGLQLQSQHRVQTDTYSSNLIASEESKSDVQMTTLAVGSFIGNQWEFDHWTIGADWVGAYVPLVSSATKKNTPRASGLQIADASETPANIWYVTQFFVGYSF
jgi:hypothetical protein